MFDALFKKYKRIIFFDTETTGLEPDKDDQMIELAAVALDRDGKQTEMDDFIKLSVKQELPQKIIDLTHILPITLSSKGLEEAQAVEKFIRLMECGGGSLLVAHNAQFDLMFLCLAIHRNREYGKGWMKAFNDADYLDTQTVYRDRHPFPHRLESAIALFGLEGKAQNSHRAVDDAKALFEVAKKLDEEKDDFHKYVNIFGYLRKFGPEKHPFRKVRYGEQGFDNSRRVPLYERAG
ncbi:MAG: 3'-5' exonuclease [Clostridia bacterium]|nr:3'-5' exonuclease [Clostridia bacterium]